jgi:PadR family transcriptional regulator
MPSGYLSFSATAILQAVANGYGYGFDVMDATGLPSGTVYPALRRMEESGLIDSRWEDAELARREQRPARKYYAITRLGTLTLVEATDRDRMHKAAAARAPRPVPSRR